MHEELQRTISIENKHTLYCFKNRGLLPLSTQTFPKKYNRKSLVKRWKSKKIEETTRTKVQESVHRLQWRDWTKLVTWTVFNTAWVRCKWGVFDFFPHDALRTVSNTAQVQTDTFCRLLFRSSNFCDIKKEKYHECMLHAWLAFC